MTGWDTPRRAEARRRMKAGEGFIYFAALNGSPLVKIGFSLDPPRRLRTMQFLGHWSLIGAIPGSLLDEKALHRTLLPVRRAHPGLPGECYPRSILSHPAIPEDLKVPA